MELTQTHLRYLLAIHDLAQTTPGVSAGDVSKVLAVSKPSVTRMMGLLMERGLLVRERYGKVFLTDAGVLAARDYQGRMERLRELIPKMGLSLSEEELADTAYLLAAALPEHMPPLSALHAAQRIGSVSRLFERSFLYKLGTDITAASV